jgi:hypothetical protein
VTTEEKLGRFVDLERSAGSLALLPRISGIGQAEFREVTRQTDSPAMGSSGANNLLTVIPTKVGTHSSAVALVENGSRLSPG